MGQILCHNYFTLPFLIVIKQFQVIKTTLPGSGCHSPSTKPWHIKWINHRTSYRPTFQTTKRTKRTRDSNNFRAEKIKNYLFTLAQLLGPRLMWSKWARVRRLSAYVMPWPKSTVVFRFSLTHRGHRAKIFVYCEVARNEMIRGDSTGIWLGSGGTTKFWALADYFMVPQSYGRRACIGIWSVYSCPC